MRLRVLPDEVPAAVIAVLRRAAFMLAEPALARVAVVPLAVVPLAVVPRVLP